MEKFFDMDNPLMTALSTAADLLVLNLLTLVCSLPLITLGAAFTAMDQVLIRNLSGEEPYLVKPFFRAFRENLRQGVLLSLILLALGGVLYVDYLYFPPLRVAVLAVGILLLTLAFYGFALLARYENSLGGTLKNAAALAVAYFPRTLVMVVFALGLWVSCIHFYRVGIPILILFGFSLPCHVSILLLNPVFRRLDGGGQDGEQDKEDS